MSWEPLFDDVKYTHVVHVKWKGGLEYSFPIVATKKKLEFEHARYQNLYWIEEYAIEDLV